MDNKPTTEPSGAEGHAEGWAGSQSKEKANTFFALYPPAPIREALKAAAGPPPPQARIVASDNLHLTLVFLGPQDEETARGLAAMPLGTGALAGCRPFSLLIDTPGRFSRTGVGWLGPKKWPAELGVLVERLRTETRELQLPQESERPPADRGFRPHITVFRRSRQLPAKPSPPIHWDVDRLFLLRSINPGSRAPGSGYSLLADWPLEM